MSILKIVMILLTVTFAASCSPKLCENTAAGEAVKRSDGKYYGDPHYDICPDGKACIPEYRPKQYPCDEGVTQ